MSNLPLVSIVTPCFNAAPFIEQTIESVAQQNYPDLEHIIVDGGSTDGTLAILSQYGRTGRLYWISEPDKGQADALNKGFRLARGEIIGWLNADDTYKPGTISRAVEWLCQHLEADGVYGALDVIGPNGDLIWHYPASLQDFQSVLLNGATIPQQSAFLRRYVVKAIEPLDVMLHYALDWEFWLKITAQFNVYPMDGIGGCLRLAPGSKTCTRVHQFWSEYLNFLERFLASNSYITPSLAHEARKRWRYVLGLSYVYAGMEETGLELLTSVLGDGEYPFESCQTAAEHAVARAWKPVHEPLPYEEALALLDRLIGLMRKFDRNLAAEIARVVSFDAYRKDKTSGALRYGVMALRISPTTWSDRGLWKRTLACVTRRVIG